MDALARYVETDMAHIDGWLTPYDAGLIAAILRRQTKMGAAGCLGEIGVHHGKLLILLQLAAQPGEAVFGVDLFADQAGNVDGSGRGDRARLEANADR